MKANPYFARLRAGGYRLHVYQSEYLDYCNAADAVVSTCNESPASSISNVGYLDAAWLTKVGAIARVWLTQSSHLFKAVLARYPELEIRRSFAGRGFDLVRAVERDVSTRRTPAEFFFVHLLLPHPPFEVDPECRFQGGVSPAIEVGRRTAYRWQVICTHRVLARLFDRIDSLYGRRAVIIVHGDHGVRGLPFNATDDRIDRFGALDITTGFSTLLAIRSPTSTGIASREAIPVQDYLWRFIDNGFTRPAVVAWDQFFYSTSIKDPHSQTRHVLSRDQMRWIPRFDQIDSLARVPPPG